MNSSNVINWEQLSLVVGDENEPGDAEMIDLYHLFVDDAGRRLRALAVPTAELDRTAVAKEAHKIRGAAASFGFDRVADILRTVETQIAELPPQRVGELLAEAVTLFEASLRGVVERYPALAA